MTASKGWRYRWDPPPKGCASPRVPVTQRPRGAAKAHVPIVGSVWRDRSSRRHKGPPVERWVRVVGFEDAGPPRGLCVVVRPVYRDPPVARPKGEETLVRLARFRVAYRHLNKEELKTMAATKKDKPTAKSDEARRLREEQAAQRAERAKEGAVKLGATVVDVGPKGAKKA